MPIFQSKRRRFEKEVMQHLDALYGTALRLTRKPDQAEDLVQETLLKAYKNMGQLRPDSNMKAWLTRVLTNTFINEYRRKKVRHAAQELHDADWMNARVASSWGRDAAKRPDGQIVDRFVREELNEAVAKLPEPYRQVLILSDVEQMAYREIAEALEVPIGTVMSRLHRARRRMRELLSDYAERSGETRVIPFAPAGRG